MIDYAMSFSEYFLRMRVPFRDWLLGWLHLVDTCVFVLSATSYLSIPHILYYV